MDDLTSIAPGQWAEYAGIAVLVLAGWVATGFWLPKPRPTTEPKEGVNQDA